MDWAQHVASQGMLPAGSWKRFAEKPGLQWLLDEGAADGRVLHHLGEEKQEYENNRIVEKEQSSLRVEQALGKHLLLANARTAGTLVTD